MSKQLVVWLVSCLVVVSGVCADTLHLSGEGAIKGEILAEKDQDIAIDIGYTVLVIPRDQVARIERGAEQSLEVPETPQESAPAVTSGVGPDRLFKMAETPFEERSVQELASEVAESVVQVRTPGGLGSGFILNKEGFLITNFHVIEGETQISVEVYHQNGQLERKTYKDIRIIALNKFRDLALLKIEDEGAPEFQSVYLGNSDTMNVGQRLFAVGSPLGLERTVTEGILSTKTRQFQGELYLQTTAQINPGNSGGPLFNTKGEVIGVTNMKMTFGEGLGFAIPVEAVKYFLRHRDAYAYDNENPSNPYRYLQPPGRVETKEDKKEESDA